jgi:hypothetical protein
MPNTVRPGAMPVPSTASTPQIYATLRKALLDHVTPAGARLSDYIGNPPRVYVRAQPSPPVFPYLTLILSRTSSDGFNGYRETAVLEVQAIGKPESQLANVEAAMDIVDDCLLRLTYATTDGLMVCRGRQRDTLPQFTDPAESAVVGVVCNYDLFLWPKVLTAHATS